MLQNEQKIARKDKIICMTWNIYPILEDMFYYCCIITLISVTEVFQMMKSTDRYQIHSNFHPIRSAAFGQVFS